VSILEVTDSETRAGSVSTRSSKSPLKSPLLLSPKKSALKDLSRKGSRKTESIKFDLSNLEHHQESEITSRFDSEESMSEDEITLRYSESSYQSPSPRKSISSRSGSVLDKLGATLSHSPSRTASTTPGSISSRSGRMLDKLGATLTLSPSRNVSTTPSSPSLRKSARGSMMVQEALGSSVRSELSDLTVASALRTRTLTPTTSNMESYSIVDLVTLDSDTSKSLYNSADSANITDYGTPTVSKRKTRSTINPTILGSSTPYIAHVRATRSRSNPNVSKVSTRSTASTRRSKSLTTPENQNISVNSTRVSRASRSRSRINDSDLLLLDDTELEDSSPKTSRRTRTKSNTIENSQVNSSVNSPEKDGISTPENRHSPVEAGTPVLSIQSLLNSSRSSLTSQNSATRGRKSVNYKRKTIGVLSVPKRRPASKSKSLGASARQTVLRLSKDSSEISDRTDEGAPRPDNEDTVTPKSAVKLVPEAVKNKHSTAKKPQSKRSIIDDLNQSDIVKQLFNSPVKRKLSRSMTEFSRKQLFEDDEIVKAKRPTRNTIALTGRTFDDSVSEHSGTFTPERFVSPISTPSNSPNLSGIKRLFQSNTPKNEPRNARSLLRTHRTRLSAKHDMNTLDGLKLMFTNSPKNRDVRDKKKSPNNDLRRVSGVKVLFRRETSPKNDLTDVRGVKKLFRTSPNNDLRNVSGVKRTMRNSLKNDLSDVRGVRKMFKHGKNKESSHDLSGVEELFNTSSQSTQHSETLFDRWVGKPTVRSVYSKTLSSKRIKNPKNQPRTLHISMDVVPNNVEEWLKQELPKRFQRGEPSASKSRNKSSNANKELQNLVTVTVAGDEPIRASRTRNSSMLKKSASEMYSAHSLPLKKRSLVEVSVEMGKPKLPLKKRAVVHSTPVKGRLHLTMNASELGRVSPIAAFDSPDEARVNGSAFRTKTTRQQKATPEAPEGRASKARTPQATPTKTSPMKSKASPKLSPKITKASPKSSPKKVVKSPPKRVTRNRKNAASETHTKKRRTSLVISKKAPVMSPKGVPNKETSQLIPIKRTTRAKKEQKVVTPKRTRVRAQRATVVVPKPSPKLKPQAKGKGNARTRENITIQVESPKESQPRKTRGKQNEPKGKPNKTDNVPAEKPKRGRRIVAIEFEPPVIVMKRGRGKETSVQEVNQKQPKTRGKKAQIPETVQPEPTTRRGRKNTENVSLQTKPKTGGKKAEPTPLKNEPKMRGKKVEAQSSVQSEPVTRARKTKVIDNTVIPETRGRKRKTVAIEEISPKVAKTETRRGRKAAETLEPVKTTKARTKDTSKTRSTRETTKTGATQDTSKT
ncbi:putative golgin IMH1, partial [Operophtera brumata]